MLVARAVYAVVCSPQSDGMAESFMKIVKRKYGAFMPKPLINGGVHIHYNEKHLHSTLSH